jgi:hypothetical protein
MDRIRSLLLARTHVVVMDPDVIADASTRPSRASDVERLEDELAQLGFVMSLDLASTLRRMPMQAIQELRTWIQSTLATEVGTQRPDVPLATAPGAAPAYVRRVLAWLATSSEQPCPWCGEVKQVGALDACGHLVCRACWDSMGFTGCPVCHRRVTHGEPFMAVPAGPRVSKHDGRLTLVHLAFDLLGAARLRFERLLAAPTPLSARDREEVETYVDNLGPRVAQWLPAVIPSRESMAIVVARLWLVAPDRAAIVAATRAHVGSATDVLRIAAVLMGGPPDLAGPMRLASVARALRRAVLSALDAQPLEATVEEMMRHRGLWKRIGERLHPFEHVDTLQNAALAFAVLRRTNLADTTFGPQLRDRAVRVSFLYVEDNIAKPIAWAGPIEDALRAGNPRSALVRLTHRPAELLRRADHLVRLAQTRQLEALQTILKAVELSATKGPPAEMLALAAHVARRGRSWKRRVFFPRGRVLDAWSRADRRPPLRGDAIAVMVGGIRRQLCNRAEANRPFARAVIDRSLVDLVVPTKARPIKSRVVWPRGSEMALPDGPEVRLFLHWQEPASKPSTLRLAVEMFDHEWQHVATAPMTRDGTTAYVDLHLEQTAMRGVRHLVMAVAGELRRLDRLPQCFVGVVLPPKEAAAFDPHVVADRFDLQGRGLVSIPLAVDISERRLRWIAVRVPNEIALAQVGGYHAALAHVGRDLGDVISTHARPTMWDVACVHAAARANVIYIRERDGSFTTYRRRDNESKTARLGRLMSGAADDGRVSGLPASDAPMWFALMTGMTLPRGSVGFVHDVRGLSPDGRGSDGIERLAAFDLVSELSLRPRDDGPTEPQKRSP